MSGDGSASDELAELYGLPPEVFTARRKELVAAARKRGDADGAKLIAAARRPTTAAWVVNMLVRVDPTARPRLSDLSDGLRAAHASMDGSRIRELTAAQRMLVSDLMRTAFKEAAIAEPTGALRDDVAGTLQAAIADPEVAARLGRLAKAERWFGFGSMATVGAVPKPTAQPEQPVDAEPAETVVAAARERVAAARRDAGVAELEHARADDVLTEPTAKLATARRRYEKLLATLSSAETDLNIADADHADATRTAQATSDRFDATKAVLAESESEFRRLAAPAKSDS